MEGLDKSFSASETLIDVEQSSQKGKNKNCLNCGAPLTGKYCAVCGQKDLPRRQGMGDLTANFIASFFGFESKFFRTFKTLIVNPGLIINDYNEGKRERYYHPARMYVFLSFIFFLIMALIPDEDKINMTENGKQLTKEEKVVVMDTTKTIPVPSTFPKTIKAYDSLQNLLPAEERDGKIKSYFIRKFIDFNLKDEADRKALLRSYAQNLQNNIPKMVFLLLPVFALILKLLYVRRDFYYAEHLVFTVFFYDFLFLVGAISLLCSTTPWLDWIPSIFFLYVMIYLFVSMRRVYKQSFMKTLLKFVILGFSFSACLLIAFAANIVITLILL